LAADRPVAPFAVKTGSAIASDKFGFGKFSVATVVSNSLLLSSSASDRTSSPIGPLHPEAFVATSVAVGPGVDATDVFGSSSHDAAGTGGRAGAPFGPVSVGIDR